MWSCAAIASTSHWDASCERGVGEGVYESTGSDGTPREVRRRAEKMSKVGSTDVELLKSAGKTQSIPAKTQHKTLCCGNFF